MIAINKVIVFDFDGVFVDSEPMKESAWWRIFSGYDKKEITPLVQKAQRKHGSGKGSRYDILADIFSGLGEERDEVDKLVSEYAQRYNSVVQDEIKKLGLLPGSLDALKALSKKYSLYLNSATPRESLVQTADNLGIRKYFKGIYGMPAGKAVNLAMIAKKENVSAKEIVFVGDGENDWQAAREFGCRFVGFRNSWNKWDKKDFPLVSGLNEIKRVTETL